MKETPTNVLDSLAALAGTQPAPTGSGRFDYIHTQGWYLDTDQTTEGQILRSRVEVTDRQLWLSPDGAGRIEETRAGSRTMSSGQYGPGGLFQISIPSAPAEGLRDALLSHNAGRTTAQWVAAVKDIWNTRAVPPALQRALLEILATRPGLHLEGVVADRAGRSGIAVSIEAAGSGGTPATRVILILSADTGMLLGVEEIALTAGDLPIEAPATIGYTLWLSSARTPTTDSSPA